MFRFRSVFVRETRVERASRGACDLTILSRWGLLIGVEVEHWSAQDPNGDDIDRR